MLKVHFDVMIFSLFRQLPYDASLSNLSYFHQEKDPKQQVLTPEVFFLYLSSVKSEKKIKRKKKKKGEERILRSIL